MAIEAGEFEKLKLDYEQVHQTFRLLTDIRFRLLAFVPASTAAIIAFLSSDFMSLAESAAPVLLVGSLGFSVTLGIVIYDRRNSELYASVAQRGKLLESLLWLPPDEWTRDPDGGHGPPPSGDRRSGGLFQQRRSATSTLFGLTIRHDVGTALIYAAVLGGWMFPITQGLRFPNTLGVVAAALVGIVSYWRLRRPDSPGR